MSAGQKGGSFTVIVAATGAVWGSVAIAVVHTSGVTNVMYLMLLYSQLTATAILISN